MIFSLDIGIDLGTSNTLVCTKNKGIVIREPSVVATDVRTNPPKVVAIGSAANRMVGRTPGAITAISPLKDSVIANFDITASMIREFIKQVLVKNPLARARTLISVPSNITEVEKKAVHDAAKAAGARFVSLIESPMAAAIGAGLDITKPEGNMIVDIGGGTTEVAVITLGDIIASKSVKYGGLSLDNAIIQYIKRNYNLLIGEKTAETIKTEIGSAVALDDEGSYFCKGRSLKDGLPSSVEITAKEVRDAISEPLNQIIETIHSTLEKTPPELSSDIIKNGIMLSGGGVQLRGLDKLISQEINVPVNIAQKPSECVITGIAICLQKNTQNIIR